MPGSRCVAVCFSDSVYTNYFHSYSLPPYKLKVMAYLERHSISLKFNSHTLQCLISNVCGFYCCMYALRRARGQPMSSFASMFLHARYTCNDIRALRIFLAQKGVSCMQPVEAAAVVMQVADINRSKITHNYQSAL